MVQHSAGNSVVDERVGRRQKILQITASATFGGGPKHLYDLVSGLGSDFDMHIASPVEEPFGSRFKELCRDQMVSIPQRRFSIAALHKLVRYIRRHEIDTIHSHGKGAGVYGRFIKMLTGVYHVHTPHGIHWMHYGLLMKTIYWTYEKLTGGFNDEIIFVSESERDTAFRHGFWHRQKHRVIHNGVDFPKHSAEDRVRIRLDLRKKLGISAEQVVAVSLSRFDYAKNMMETCRIAQKSPSITYLFVGDGVGIGECHKYCTDHNMSNVLFPGFTPDPLSYLITSDIYVSSSRWEGLPLSVLEGLGHGLSCVLSTVSGNKDTIESGKQGFLYRLGDPEEAAGYMNKLCDEPSLRKELSEHAVRRHEAMFALPVMLNKTRDMYHQIGQC